MDADHLAKQFKDEFRHVFFQNNAGEDEIIIEQSPPPPPRPLPVILTDEELHNFTLVDDALSSILLRPEVADRKVSVVSVAGAFRKGKSFLLNFFLRFLQVQVKNVLFPVRTS